MSHRPSLHYAWIVLGGTFVALLAAGHQLGALLTAFGAGWARTSFGDYRAAFYASGSLCLLGALLALQIGVRRAGGEGRPEGEVAPAI
jgi:hypothetical protein